MRIALVRAQLGGKAGGGGGARLLLESALGLRRLGHEVTIACHNFEPASDFDGWGEFDVRHVQSRPHDAHYGKLENLRRFWLEMPKLAKLIPRGTEVVNAHEWPALHAGSLAARRLGIPLVWTRNDHLAFEPVIAPGVWYRRGGFLPERVARAVTTFPDLIEGRRADAVVVLDERSAAAVERIYGTRAHILRAGPSAAFFDPPERSDARERLGLAEDVRLVVAVGILNRHRGFETLIEAVAMLRGPPLPQVRIVGSDYLDPGYADGLERLASELGVSGRVALVRQSLPEPGLLDFYAAADVFVHPNHRQSYGLAPLEALAAGTPVILSRGAGVAEVLEGRRGVRLVQPADPGELAIALRDGVGRGGLEETRTWLRAELSRERYAELLADVCAGVTMRR